jgi:Domain of unknown function (DUF4276)
VRYLQPALYAEGATDERFLGQLLWRLCDDLCLNLHQQVEVAPVEVLPEAKTVQAGEGRHDRILAAAQAASDLWTVLFVHADADGDAIAARANRAAPAINFLHQRFAKRSAVAVVPVRMTEAWMLQDGDALRDVLGCTLSDQHWGLPGSDVGIESIRDPKQMLEHVFLSTQPSGPARRRGIGGLYAPLGERVRLDRLRLLPSFRETDQELRAALIAQLMF